MTIKQLSIFLENKTGRRADNGGHNSRPRSNSNSNFHAN